MKKFFITYSDLWTVIHYKQLSQNMASQLLNEVACVKHYYRPQRSWGKVMFLQVCVILFTGGEYLTRYTLLDQVPPRTRYIPPRPGTPPPGQGTPPGPGTPPWTMYNPRTRYTPPGQGTPPRTRYPPDQVQPPWDQGDTVYAQLVRILLECILVGCVYEQNSIVKNLRVDANARPNG